MNRPPPPHTMGNVYRGPRPFHNRWRPRGPHPPMGFQNRPNTYPRTPYVMNSNGHNDEHWCETCDRGFATADLLDKHKQQHQKCNIDGCQFVAHPKVVTKHIQMQHSSGIYKKIAKLNNPDEINKWREERKKKYPTRVNIEKKAAECKEKIERGEKMALKHEKNDKNKSADFAKGNKRRHSFDKREHNQRANGANFNHRQNPTPNNKIQPPPKKVPRVIPKIPTIIEKNRLKPFTGILNIDMDDDNDKTEVVSNKVDNDNTLIEDDYYEEPVANDSPEIKLAQESVVCGALTSLMCDYGSSDDETDEKENNAASNIKSTMQDKPIDKKIFENNVGNINKDNRQKEMSLNIDRETEVMPANQDTLKKEVEQEVENKQNNSDDDSPEEVKTIKSNVQEPIIQKDCTKNAKPAVPFKKNPPIKSNQRQNNRYNKYKVPSTLLHKLLHKEIRQERNMILQCIRYIKKMNYFNDT